MLFNSRPIFISSKYFITVCAIEHFSKTAKLSLKNIETCYLSYVYINNG